MAFRCTGLTREFRNQQGGITRALEDVSFEVAEGEFVCVVGPSGCGKTTLLRLVAGLLTPTSGRVEIDGRNDGTPPTTLVFQEHGIFEWMDVLDNVAFALEARGVARAERREGARRHIERVGLGEFANAYPHQLSVGMRQRVAIARAFLAGSPLLLMDEPFGSLDPQTKIVLQEDLLSIWAQEKKSVLYVTHDIEEAVALGDRVLVMTGRPGKIKEEISVTLARPRALGPKKSPEATPIEWHVWKLLEQEVRESLRLYR